MSFEKINKKLGFGAMRLKMNGDKVDYDEFIKMADTFMENGFNYFDTAHGYIEGKSEIAIGECISPRYKREDFILANKLSEWFVKKEEEVIPFFEKQLETCRVDYFDFYLCHAVCADNYEKYKSINAFEIQKKLKEQGKIKHIAISFHDSAEVLDRILTEQPQLEAVQLQINYLDYDDPGVQSEACYNVAVKHGKKVIVMEPVKGGALVNLPSKAAELLDELNGGSYASYALRFAASHPEVIVVLSGMGNADMMTDNINTFNDFKPVTEEEYKVLKNVSKEIRKAKLIPCTACNYCADVCPEKLSISRMFGVYNGVLGAGYNTAQAKEKMPEGKNALDCIKCGKCETVCPQNIEIRAKLEEIGKKVFNE